MTVGTNSVVANESSPYSFALPGLAEFLIITHGLRRGLNSCGRFAAGAWLASDSVAPYFGC